MSSGGFCFENTQYLSMVMEYRPDSLLILFSVIVATQNAMNCLQWTYFSAQIALSKLCAKLDVVGVCVRNFLRATTMTS